MLDIEIADDDYSRETGLMYRESMEENQGMLFIYNRESMRNFYMNEVDNMDGAPTADHEGYEFNLKFAF